MRDIETGNVFSFPAGPLKCFTLSPGAGESTTSGKSSNAIQDLLDASHVLLSRPPNSDDNFVLVKFGFSALSVPRLFGV